MQLQRIILPILLLTLLAGCGRDARLHGNWIFDREYTEAQLTKEADEKPPANSIPGAFKNMVAGLKDSVASMLVDQLDGVTMKITSKDMIMVTKDGSGQDLAYEVIDRPTADSWLIKTSDGKVETYYREGERLATPSAGDAHFKVYFKRASQ